MKEGAVIQEIQQTQRCDYMTNLLLFEQSIYLNRCQRSHYHDTEVGPMIDNEVMQAFESLKEPQRLSSFTQLITCK